jgi:glycosyltransferase involved in cell wall biosynthesis
MNLSIIMPVYNAKDTISRSIDSFIELSNLSDINCKLYVIDDFSNDGTSEKLKSYSLLNSNIILIKNDKNMGPGLSRNVALYFIKKGYIGFLDADDEILSDGYLEALKSGINQNADWITFNGLFCSNNIESEKYDFNRLVNNTEDLAKKCLRGELDGSVIFSIYSRDLILNNNLKFPSGFYEDIPFAYSAMLLANKRHISNRYAYKKHNIESSIVNTISEKHINGLINSSNNIIENIESLNILRYENFNRDKFFGIFGYIANLIRSIIICNSSKWPKDKLFNKLSTKINSTYDFKELNYNVVTKKDKLAIFFLKNYNVDSKDFKNEMKSYYQTVFDEKI